MWFGIEVTTGQVWSGIEVTVGQVWSGIEVTVLVHCLVRCGRV